MSTLHIPAQDTLRRIRAVQTITIAWMGIEAALSLWASWDACSPALAAFGGDSVIELFFAAVVLWRFRNGNIAMVKNSSVIWGSSVLWGSSVVWGTSVIWGTNLSGQSVLWGSSVVWGSSSDQGYSVLWGSSVVWGSSFSNTMDAESVILLGEN